MDTTSFTTQSLSTDQPFRFMDLPTELRLYIAEYVLCADEPLQWKWLASGVKGGFKSGTFRGLYSLATFTRASRQIDSETAGLLWRLNTFRFGGYLSSRDGLQTFLKSSFNDLESIVPAHKLFIHLTPEMTIQLLPAVEFHLEVGWQEHNIIRAFEAIANFARGNLRAQFVLKDILWCVHVRSWCDDEHQIARQVGYFMSNGHHSQSVLSKVGDVHFCNVQISPNLDDEQRRAIEKFLNGEELQLARAWDKYGLKIGHN